jgi:hypothetical protein
VVLVEMTFWSPIGIKLEILWIETARFFMAFLCQIYDLEITILARTPGELAVLKTITVKAVNIFSFFIGIH